MEVNPLEEFKLGKIRLYSECVQRLEDMFPHKCMRSFIELFTAQVINGKASPKDALNAIRKEWDNRRKFAIITD